MYQQLQYRLEQRLNYLLDDRISCKDEKIVRKKQLLQARHCQLLKVKASGKVLFEDQDEIQYKVHLKYLMKQNDYVYIEEEVEHRVAVKDKKEVIDDREKPFLSEVIPIEQLVVDGRYEEERGASFQYDRIQAVQYAERWWNSYNPAYPKFSVDCTNYISQCLRAGGAPMRGHPHQGKGWWIGGKSWSYSWSVAHALRWFLPSSTIGLRATEVSSPDQLQPGDVICIDFQGDGRFDHTVFVIAQDREGMPLVNAHTANSRMRYWSYEDSTAYTENIQYKFMKILDDQA
ncbi:amidase domain-containing protein [Bacillus sp. REN10]|uniref:amidase domain-containing protein n=1 Tax=Bacillus sp. REN10 TaxID=2782541 RepID=UPI00193C389A|nr:amidase domain-containing protein [Bacillus sp. REN10]